MDVRGKQVSSRPDWLKVRVQNGPNFTALKTLMRSMSLHTVCEEARCPNIYECWENRTATFMILGRICTRACRFCAVTSGRPTELDLEEPERVAAAVEEMRLRHVVVTSVARDDLTDGGASIFAETIRAVRAKRPLCGIEVLIPDFQGSEAALSTVLEAEPDLLNHNIETVERLSDSVRSRAMFQRSIGLLGRSKRLAPHIRTKSSIMVGLGESWEELLHAMKQLRDIECDILTLGQYLQPTSRHFPIMRYYTPDEFAQLKKTALAMGFAHVESGPLVRSSYHAHEQVVEAGRFAK